MDTLPPEVLLYFVSFLPLASLLAARGVNTRWRYFAQGASLHPARKILLDLYLAAIDHPNFPSLVVSLQPHVREFDREAYISDLTSRGCVLPDVFELWILEWPSGAVHFLAWPGLAKDVQIEHRDRYCHGQDLLDGTAPIMGTIPLPKKNATAHVGEPTCQALALYRIYIYWDVGEVVLWLVVDANERINDRRTGRLLWTYSYYHFTDGVINAADPHKIFYDAPFGPSTDCKMSDFLTLLDTSHDQVDRIVDEYSTQGVRLTDDI